jgi:hypothetical protein
MAKLLGWGPVQQPRAVIAAADFALLLERTEGARHCGAMRSDEIREPLVRKRERYCDAVRQDSAPPFGQVPQRQQQPVIDPLMMSDGQGDGERVSAPRPAVEKFQPELRPGGHAHHQAVIEHSQPRGLQDDPANLGLNVRSLVVPAPRANHVARADQFHAPPPEHLDFTADQSIDDQEAAMMTVGLLGAGDIPITGRQASEGRLGLTPGPLIVAGGQEIPHLRVGIDNADGSYGGAHWDHDIRPSLSDYGDRTVLIRTSSRVPGRWLRGPARS